MISKNQMKMKARGKKNAGLTLVELLVVIAIIALLAAVLFPAMSRARLRGPRVACMSNLKQIGLAFQLWSLENGGRYPMGVSTNDGGAMEPAELGRTWPVFQVMSNELATTRVLVCPADLSRAMAKSFAADSPQRALSYFVGLDAESDRPDMMLTGDSDLGINGGLFRPGVVVMVTNRQPSWGGGRHGDQGNVLLVDGGVCARGTKKFREELSRTGSANNRLVFP
jgi:prepilin-type N-terminal cleavage/methylation domain-containing protein/prepilin-type processing-associated H-X9-DG protein